MRPVAGTGEMRGACLLQAVQVRQLRLDEPQVPGLAMVIIVLARLENGGNRFLLAVITANERNYISR